MGNVNGFLYNGRRYQFAYDLGERAVEVPIVLDLIKGYEGILEVGNVLSNWIGRGHFGHKVIDKYEIGPGIVNEDIVDYQTSYLFNWVVCISTLEHIGKDPPEEPFPDKPFHAFQAMKRQLVPGGIMVVTWPVGYNLYLDRQFANGLFNFSYCDCMKRVSEEQEWVQCEWKDVKDCQYGTPYYAGNGLVIAYYVKS